MKITISQQDLPAGRHGKKIDVEFRIGKLVDKFVIDKADCFIDVLDKFIIKRKMDIKVLKETNLKFVNTGVLTERVIRSIMLGLRFNA